MTSVGYGFAETYVMQKMYKEKMKNIAQEQKQEGSTMLSVLETIAYEAGHGFGVTLKETLGGFNNAIGAWDNSLRSRSWFWSNTERNSWW
ncbi:hypothetical protein QL285_028023 [Trifolium repens]|nr:hypothetical protein QL285_028023 [Trifolium repens]